MKGTTEEAERLASGACGLGLELDPGQTGQLLCHLDLLYRWNPSAGLTTVPRQEAWRLHLLDSLSLVAHVAGTGPLADLGSGGGFPGLPLAVAIEGLTVELVDSRRRCCSFLAQAVAELGLSERVRVRETGAEGLSGPYRTVVSRAYLPPAGLARLAAGLLEPGGRLLVMCSGRSGLAVEELAARTAGLSSEAEYRFELPGGSESRSILVLERGR